MNKSPDWTDPWVNKTVASLEDQLRAADRPPADPELAGDWALRRELQRFQPEPLPADLADRWKQAMRPARRGLNRAWGLAIAACLVAALSLALLMPTREPELDPVALKELQLAMQTVDTTSRLALSITERELNEHLKWPSIELEPLPYSQLVRTIAQPGPTNATNNIQTNQE